MTRKDIYEQIDDFSRAYIEAALWSSDDDNGTSLCNNYSIDDISDATLLKMITDCQQFQRLHGSLINSRLKEAGHDLWFTRNGHGVGFWEKSDWPEKDGEVMTATCRKLKEVELYVGDDGLIYS